MKKREPPKQYTVEKIIKILEDYKKR